MSEKRQIQALDRIQPRAAVSTQYPEGRTGEYTPHCATTLFATVNLMHVQ